MKNTFNEFRFKGLNFRKCSNKYYEMRRVSEDQKRIVVKSDASHLIRTAYGYAFILNRSQVVFIKDWQVSNNWFGCEVLLDRDYFNVKDWGCHEGFSETGTNCNFDFFLETAQEQEARNNLVKWQIGD